MAEKIKFYGDQAVILPDTPPDFISGIYILEEARKPTNTGTIMSIAPNEELKDGDKVFYNHRQGYEIEYEGKKYLSLKSNYISGTIKNEIMQPLHSRILVEPFKKNETLSDGGVVLLEDKTIAEGRVVATGSGTSTEPMILEVNDIVIYPKNAGVRIGEQLILAQTEVMAIKNEQYVEEGND